MYPLIWPSYCSYSVGGYNRSEDTETRANYLLHTSLETTTTITTTTTRARGGGATGHTPTSSMATRPVPQIRPHTGAQSTSPSTLVPAPEPLPACVCGYYRTHQHWTRPHRTHPHTLPMGAVFRVWSWCDLGVYYAQVTPLVLLLYMTPSPCNWPGRILCTGDPPRSTPIYVLCIEDIICPFHFFLNMWT